MFGISDASEQDDTGNDKCKYYVEPMIYLGVQFQKEIILYKNLWRI